MNKFNDFFGKGVWYWESAISLMVGQREREKRQENLGRAATRWAWARVSQARALHEFRVWNSFHLIPHCTLQNPILFSLIMHLGSKIYAIYCGGNWNLDDVRTIHVLILISGKHWREAFFITIRFYMEYHLTRKLVKYSFYFFEVSMSLNCTTSGPH